MSGIHGGRNGVDAASDCAYVSDIGAIHALRGREHPVSR